MKGGEKIKAYSEQMREGKEMTISGLGGGMKDVQKRNSSSRIKSIQGGKKSIRTAQTIADRELKIRAKGSQRGKKERKVVFNDPCPGRAQKMSNIGQAKGKARRELERDTFTS